MARLLVVEDSPELAGLIAAAASARGHSTRTVGTGHAALTLLQSERFDGAIVDLNLPDMRGAKVLQQLRARKVAALAMSGVFRGADVAREAMRVHGAREFLEKPFPMSKLLQAVDRLTQPEPRPEAELELATIVDEPDDEPIGALPTDELPDLEVQPEELLEVDDEFATLAAAAAAEESAFDAGFHGPLGPGAVPRLLWSIARARDDGELLLRGASGTRAFLMKNGQPRAVRASNPEENRGTQQVTRSAREEHIRNLVWDCFRWTEGEYVFTRRPADPSLRRDPAGRLPGDWIFAGVLATETSETLAERMPPGRLFFPTQEAGFVHHHVTLSPQEAELLASADGTKTVQDLLLLTLLPPEQALAALRGFELLGLLEERAPPDARRRVSFGI